MQSNVAKLLVECLENEGVTYAESFGAKGYRIDQSNKLLPILKQAFADDTVSVTACPVDYSENIKLTNKLGTLTESI